MFDTVFNRPLEVYDVETFISAENYEFISSIVYQTHTDGGYIEVKKVVSFSLDEGTVKKLNSEAKALGMSKSQLLEFMLQKGWRFSGEIEEETRKIAQLQEKARKKHLGNQVEE